MGRKSSASEIKVKYTIVNSEFNKAIKAMEGEIKNLDKAFKLQKEEMKLTATESEKLSAALEHLKQKQALAKEKVEQTKKALDNAKKTFGENSKEAQNWSNKLIDAKKNEAYLANQISETNKKLEQAKNAESEAAKASQKRREKLQELAQEQDKLSSKTDSLTAKYDSQVKSLGNNASESDKLKLRQAYLKEAMSNTKQEVENLKERLKVAKEEFGENSTEVNNLEKELAEATKKAAEFKNEYADVGNKSKKVSDQLRQSGKVISGIGDSYTKKVSLPLIAGIASAIKVSSDMETAFTGVRKTVDEVRDKNGKLVVSYKDIENGIKEMAETMPTSAVEIANVAQAAGQLGVKGDDVLAFSKTMVELGESTNLSATDAATAIARFTNIMGGSLKDVDRLGSSIVYLGNNYATTESEITNMAMRLAGSGHQIGLSEQNVLALATAMSSMGIEADAGGSSMSKVMTKMQNAVSEGGKKLEAFARVSGMSAGEFAKKFKEKPIEAIDSFIKGLGNMSKKGSNVNTVLEELGITELRETDTLKRLSGGQDILSRAIKDSNKAWDENKALTEEAEKKNDTLAGKMAILRNKVMNFLDDAGKPFADMLLNIFELLKPVIKKLSELAKKFNEASPETKKIVMSIIALAIAIGPLLSIFGRLITGLGTISGAWSVAFSGASAATPAIKGLAMLIKGFSKIGGPLLGIFKGIFTSIGGLLLKLLPLVMGVFKSIGAFLLANPLALVLVAVVAALAFIWYKWGDDIKAFFKKHWEELKESFTQGWKNITEGLSNLWKGFIEGAKAIWDGLKNIFSFLWLGIKEIFNIGWLAVSTPIRLAWEVFIGIAKVIWEPLAKFFSDMFTGIGDTAKGVWQSILDFTMLVWRSIADFLKDTWSAISDFASSIFNGIKDTISFVFNFIDNSIIKPIWNSISDFLSSIWNGISTKASQIYEGIKNFLGSTWDNIKSKAVSSWSNIKSNLGQHWDNIKTNASNKFRDIKNSISSVWDAVKRNTSSKWGAIKDVVSSKMDFMKTIVRRGLDSVKSFFSNLKIRFPHIKLPHFSISGSFSLDPPSIPHISVDWYKTGAIAKRASIVGIGEAGNEAVVPLQGRYMYPFAKAIADRINMMNSRSSAIINIQINQDIKENVDYKKGVEIIDKELEKRGYRLNYGTGGI